MNETVKVKTPNGAVELELKAFRGGKIEGHGAIDGEITVEEHQRAKEFCMATLGMINSHVIMATIAAWRHHDATMQEFVRRARAEERRIQPLVEKFCGQFAGQIRSEFAKFCSENGADPNQEIDGRHPLDTNPEEDFAIGTSGGHVTERLTLSDVRPNEVVRELHIAVQHALESFYALTGRYEFGERYVADAGAMLRAAESQLAAAVKDLEPQEVKDERLRARVEAPMNEMLAAVADFGPAAKR